MEPRPRDRLDRRLAAGRLSARHVRAIGRALAALRGAAGGDGLSCESVFVRKKEVQLAPAPGGVGADDVAALVRELRARGTARRAEQLAASFVLAADDYALYGRLGALADEPLVIATGGRVASGKSTVAKAVSRRLAAPRVVADRVRETLLADAPDGTGHELAWAPDFGARVYGGLFARAEDVLASRRAVVLDACFPSAARRREAAALARRHGARFVFAHCEAPPEDIARRLRWRDVRDGTEPGAWEKIANELEAQWEPPRASEPGRLVRVDTHQQRRAWLRALRVAKREPA